MDKKTVRTGIVGAGFSASFHFEALRKVYGTAVEVVGVHCRTEATCRAFAEKRGIKAYDSLDALIDDTHGRYRSNLPTATAFSREKRVEDRRRSRR